MHRQKQNVEIQTLTSKVATFSDTMLRGVAAD